MKKGIVFIFVSMICMNVFSETSDSMGSAIHWLEIIDSEKYEQSWHEAAPFFKNQMGKAQWMQALNRVRLPLGSVQSRKVKSANEHTSLPNAPDGEYVVITLLTDFEKKNASIETITVSKVDNEWKAVGYFIK
ncbi:DUF4019 domain-containing protein [Teredinibacter turnerae]|uniref:DUF4019 domain-containing protein n=1 Tax=Teredinibacter turnerae TaxID=2426 RepID=UPI000429791D|nr:DUF4019 domain-containing protein [Teredinibacter turnerae]